MVQVSTNHNLLEEKFESFNCYIMFHHITGVTESSGYKQLIQNLTKHNNNNCA